MVQRADFLVLVSLSRENGTRARLSLKSRFSQSWFAFSRITARFETQSTRSLVSCLVEAIPFKLSFKLQKPNAGVHS